MRLTLHPFTEVVPADELPEDVRAGLQRGVDLFPLRNPVRYVERLRPLREGLYRAVPGPPEPIGGLTPCLEWCDWLSRSFAGCPAAEARKTGASGERTPLYELISLPDRSCFYGPEIVTALYVELDNFRAVARRQAELHAKTDLREPYLFQYSRFYRCFEHAAKGPGPPVVFLEVR